LARLKQEFECAPAQETMPGQQAKTVSGDYGRQIEFK
jgi:hypothetical protein